MAESTKTETAASGQGTRFTTTHWSVVLSAREHDSPQAAAALEKLCRTYWYPLYAYVRRQGHDEPSAKDLTQEFFVRLLHKNRLDHVQREKGRFRSFLLASLKHFLADEWDKTQALKRGGGQSLLSLDDDTAEDRYQLEPADNLTPDKLFEQQWALTLLDQAKTRLKEEYAQAGKADLFERLRVFEAADPAAPTYAQIAAEFGLTESAVKSAARRLRQRYGGLVREEVAHTVDSPVEVDEELRHLISALSG
jgi:RNA polymerase sigma-70 factor (ECF subfamily)